MAMNRRIIGDEVIGSGISIKVIDFIEKTLKILKIKYSIESKNKLKKIICKDKIIAQELSQDKIDLKRKFCFDGINKNKCFQLIKFLGGEELILKLIEDEKRE